MKVKVKDLKKIITEHKQLNETRLILERIDFEALKQINSSLNSINNLIKGFNLPELKSGIQKAAGVASGTIGDETLRGALAGAFPEGKFKDWISGVSAIASFQSGVVKGFRQFPEIVDFMLKMRMDEKGTKRALKLIKSAFSPPGFMAQLRGLPFVNDDKLAQELAQLNHDELQELANRAQRIELPEPKKEDLKQLAILNQKASKTPEEAKEELVKEPEVEISSSEEEIENKTDVVITANSFMRFMKKTFPESSRESVMGLASFLTKKGVKFK